jgi:hypothetical protein
MAKKKKKNKNKKVPKIADGMDALDLYEKSVQNPEADVEFLEETFKNVSGRAPMTLREDFCGTAAMSTFVRKR